MKTLSFYLISFFLTISSYGQIESSSPLSIDFSGLNTNGNNNDTPVNNTPKNNLDQQKEIELPEIPNILSPKSLDGLNNYKSNIDADNFGTLNPKKIEFGAAPTVNKYYIKPKPVDLNIFPKRQNDNEKKIFHDVDLGEFVTKSEFFYFSLADYGSIDGDQVNITVNDKTEYYDFFIGPRLKSYKIDLNIGFNVLEIVGINNGSSGPITCYLIITDDNGEVILKQAFTITTGFKAKALVIREEK